MMGSKLLINQARTNKGKDAVVQAVAKSLSIVGGTQVQHPTGIQIIDGKEGVNFAFTANFTTDVTITPVSDDVYNIACNVNWKMNSLTIACLIIGIFVFGVLWIVPALHLFIDPSNVYNMALMSVQGNLN